MEMSVLTATATRSGESRSRAIGLGASALASVGWGFGAFLGLLAALVAGGPVLVPAARSYLESRKAR